MTVQRQQVGDTETYRGHEIIIESAPPDMTGKVDGEGLRSWRSGAAAIFMKESHARDACRKYIDGLILAEGKA